MKTGLRTGQTGYMTEAARAARKAADDSSAPTMHDERTLLEVDALQAGYGRPAMEPVSLRVRAGETIGIRGPNGCGKSTLLNALAGSARIFAGRVVRRPGLRVAHQHQNPLPLENVPLSGDELLALTRASSRGVPGWIAPLLPRRLDRLSGGQLQFLQVWACLRAPVDLVLLDEPTNNVDRAGIECMLAEIQRLRGRVAMVLTSHEPRFLESVCDRILDMRALDAAAA